MLGQVFDRRFRIDAKIAAGGFGAIYRVTHVRSGHEFALKVLHPNLTSDPRVVARFQREGAALTRLRDPHTITAYELGEAPDGTLYIVMELLKGESLYERFRAQGALPWRPVLALARAVCSSLTEAHGLGIIHRDLKPTNIHLEPGEDGMEYVKVLDFGIAKILQGRDNENENEIDASDLTHVGQMIGTLDYMSPEQMVGGECGPSSDIYTLGVVMYEMIAGRKPYEEANSAAAALAAVLTVTPPRLSTLAILSPDADRVVMRCLERSHGDRFQTAGALADALDEILTGAEEAVTSVAPSHRAASKTASAIPAVGRPSRAKRITPAAAKPASTDPSLDSTLVGHEPVARLPATPLRPAGTPHVGTPAVGTPQIESLGTLTPEPLAPAHLAPEPLGLEVATIEEIPIPSVVIAPDFPDIPAPKPSRRSSATATPTGTAAGPSLTTTANGTPIAPTSNLREAYPMIHRQPPSPTRPQPTADERGTTTAVVPFDMAHAVRRDALVRRLAVVIGLAVAALVALWFASRF